MSRSRLTDENLDYYFQPSMSFVTKYLTRNLDLLGNNYLHATTSKKYVAKLVKNMPWFLLMLIKL